MQSPKRVKLSFWFVVRTLPVFVLECCRMAWARRQGRVYVAPRDRGRRTEDRGRRTEDGRPKTEDRRPKTEDGGRKTENRRLRTAGIMYQPHPARFGAVVQFPMSGTGYVVGPGGNLVSLKRQKQRNEKGKR